MIPAFLAEDLVYEYDSGRALDGASFTAPQGEITALVGPNGAGKTTLMRLLAGLTQPQAGRAAVLGVDVAQDPRAVHRMVGWLGDFIGLWDRMSVAEHLEHAGRCAGLSGGAARKRAVELADALDLTELLANNAGQLSRGQRQRVAIAQALVKKPKALILDEPASGLDPEARKNLSRLLLDLKADGATLLVSSHILSELDDYSDRIVVIRDGRIQRATALRQLETEAALIEIALAASDADLSGALARIAPNVAVRHIAPDRAEVALSGGATAQAELLGALVRAGLPVCAFSPRRKRLEDAYFAQEDAAE